MSNIFDSFDSFDDEPPVTTAPAGRIFQEVVCEQVAFSSLDQFFRPDKHYAVMYGTRRAMSTRARSSLWKSAKDVPALVFLAAKNPAQRADALLRGWEGLGAELAQLTKGRDYTNLLGDRWARATDELKALLNTRKDEAIIIAWWEKAMLLVIDASCLVEEAYDA
jgi:hypothetical protein